MLDPQRAEQGLAALNKLGVGISVDDFGTGYTSLASIKWLPIKEIKIDRSFITHMLNDTRDSIMARAVIDLGRNLGLTVVAEGVESQAVINALGGLGCDQAQGYFISRPLTGTALNDWFAASPWSGERANER
jgi:EAL domain-containing protein (putative c-di-GMP-specific phosphodiesterase class I)